MRNLFLGDITEKRRSTIVASFQKLCPGIKTPKKDELIILGSPLGPKSQADLLEMKINELEKINGIVEKLDAHHSFFMLRNCFSLPKLLYFLRTSACFNYPALLEKNDKTVCDGFPKCVMWTSTIFRVLSWLCLLRWVVLRSWGFIRIIISTSRLFDLSFWCQWLSHDNCFGNIRRCLIYKSAWEMVEFDEWTEKSSWWNPEKLDTTCLRQNRPRTDFQNGWQTYRSFQSPSR